MWIQKIIILDALVQFKEIGEAVFRGREIIDESRPSEETNAELKERLLWKLYSKCKNGSQFYKKYFRAQCIFDDKGNYFKKSDIIKRGETTLRRDDYDDMMLEIVVPQMLISESVITELNLFKKTIEAQGIKVTYLVGVYKQ